MSGKSIELESPFGHSGWIELRDARVIDSNAPAIATTIVSRKDEPLWVRFSIDQVNGDGDCENELQLDPRVDHPYLCPQASVEAGARYRAEVVVFEDVGNTKIAERMARMVTIVRGPSGALELAGRPTR